MSETTESVAVEWDKTPHWYCVQCGHREEGPGLDLEEQVCGCGRGAGKWVVENGHLISRGKKKPL